MLQKKFNDYFFARFALDLKYSAANWGGHLHLEILMNALVFGLPTNC